MTAITLPADLEAWARAEVAAGRAESVEALVAKGLRGYRLGIIPSASPWTMPLPKPIEAAGFRRKRSSRS